MKRIKLNDGSEVRVFWRHVNADDKMLMDHPSEWTKADRAIFDEAKDLGLGEVDTFRRYARSIGFSRCTIESVADKKVLGIGRAWCSKKDKFDKESGRRVSLLRALDAAIPLSTVPGHGEEWKQRKALRRQVWDSYFQRGLEDAAR